MIVKVEGVVLEVLEKIDEKNGKTFTVRLYQPGERELVEVRTKSNGYKSGEKVQVAGRLFAYKQRDGSVREMVIVD